MFVPGVNVEISVEARFDGALNFPTLRKFAHVLGVRRPAVAFLQGYFDGTQLLSKGGDYRQNVRCDKATAGRRTPKVSFSRCCRFLVTSHALFRGRWGWIQIWPGLHCFVMTPTTVPMKCLLVGQYNLFTALNLKLWNVG